MKMKKIAAYIALCALAILCLCTAIEVKFTLASGEEPLVCTVPEGVFRKIGGRKNKLRYLLSCGLGQSSFAPEEECKSSLTLSNISTREQYKHFTAFWETDLAVLSEKDNKLSKYQADLTQELFDRFLLTANFLEIQGKHAELFAWNMVWYGLLGKHSKDITDLSQYQDKDVSHSIFWSLLRAFLNQTGFNYKITNPSAEQTMLRIEKADSWSRQIDKEYKAPAQTTSIRTVLYNSLGITQPQRRERKEAVLSWLLLSIGGSSIDIQYPTNISSKDIFEFTQTIQNLTKHNMEGSRVYVEGLTLNVNYRNSTSLSPAFQLVSDFSCLTLYIGDNSGLNTELSSLFSSINPCKSLKALKITGLTLDSIKISMLLKSIPKNIVYLSFSCNILEDIAICSLNECSHLESLEIYGKAQLNVTVQALVKNLPFIKELSITCDVLDSTTANSFKACKKLESLEIDGKTQSSTAIEELLKNLPFIKKLRIKCGVLDPGVAKSFRTCKHLEKLEIEGKPQIDPSFFITLLEALLSLQDLKIEIYTTDIALAEALRKCSNMHSLDLIVWGRYTPGFLERYLKNPLPTLTSLKFRNDNIKHGYSKGDKEAVENARQKGVCIFLL